MREKILRDKEMRRRKAAEELKKDDVSISRLILFESNVLISKNSFRFSNKKKSRLMNHCKS